MEPEQKSVQIEELEAVRRLAEDTARLEVVKAVRDNLLYVEEFWKFRRNMLMAAGIMIESDIQMTDFGDTIELRITCRIPEVAGKYFLERRDTFRKLSKILEERGKEYLCELFAMGQKSGMKRYGVEGD